MNIRNNSVNPMLLTDFYKTIHHLAYVPKMDFLVSYWTPRMTRIEGINKVVSFGLQALIKSYLIDMFDQNFFRRDFAEIEKEYKRVIANTMTVQAADTTELKRLHDLGYLPIRIKAVAEGERVDIKTPMFEISNTVPGFGWLVNYLETPISAQIWHPMTSGTIAFEYRKLVEEYFTATVDDSIPKNTACGDFSMRGMTSFNSAMHSSSAHLLSFVGTATIPAILWLEDFYNCDCEKEVVGRGVPSTEHSVMSSYGRDGEFECYRHLIEDVFKTGPLSIVSDTYDYWNVITEYLPKLKESILRRDGKIIIRGDSGDPVDIICGTYFGLDGEYPELDYSGIDAFFREKASKDFQYQEESWRSYDIKIKDGAMYRVKCYYVWEEDEESYFGGYRTQEVDEVEITPIELAPEAKGTVELLWDIFGGRINEKGYKVLDPHIGAIYGDSITLERAKEIYRRLKKKGFAVNNCTLGIGSYTYQHVTRDTLGFALKATNSVIDGVEKPIYKDPATDKSKGNNFKKSQRGMCYVYRDGDNIKYTDGHTMEQLKSEEFKDNLLETIFENGKLVKEYSLAEIRNRLHNNGF